MERAIGIEPTTFLGNLNVDVSSDFLVCAERAEVVEMPEFITYSVSSRFLAFDPAC